jgi:hypothetical protein
MGEPPVLVGAVQLTVTLWLAPLPITPVGAPGTLAGTTAADATDGALAPTEFEAVTLKVYDLPSLSPETVQVSAPVVEQVAPPGEAVTV